MAVGQQKRDGWVMTGRDGRNDNGLSTAGSAEQYHFVGTAGWWSSVNSLRAEQ